MELQGTIKKISDLQTFPSGFQKKELVLVTQEQYPQPISIEFTQEKINLLDSVNVGEDVKIGINIRGREWTSPQNEVKYFNSITGWRIEKISANSAEPTQAASSNAAAPSAKSEDVFSDDNDDDGLPF